MQVLSSHKASVPVSITILVVGMFLRYTRVIFNGTTNRQDNTLSNNVVQVGHITLVLLTLVIHVLPAKDRRTNRVRNLFISTSQMDNRHLTLGVISVHIRTYQGKRSRYSTSGTSKSYRYHGRHTTLLNARVIRTRYRQHTRQRKYTTRNLIRKDDNHFILG